MSYEKWSYEKLEAELEAAHQHKDRIGYDLDTETSIIEIEAELDRRDELAESPDHWQCECCNVFYKNVEPFKECEHEHQCCDECTKGLDLKYDEDNYITKGCPVCARECNEKNKRT